MAEEICPNCGGTGKEVPYCQGCEGIGWVSDPSDGGVMVCPECGNDACFDCGGEGYIDFIEDEDE